MMKHQYGNGTEPLDRYNYTRQSSLANAQRARSRVRTLLSALCIGIFLVYSRLKAPAGLPETYGLCASEGGKIYTVDSAASEVECIIVSGANVVDSGDLAHIKRKWGDGVPTGLSVLRNPLSSYAGTPLFFLQKGQAVYPGFTDSHAHVLSMSNVPYGDRVAISQETLAYGNYKELPLTGASSIDGKCSKENTVVPLLTSFAHPHPEVVQRICDYINARPDLSTDVWIEGFGWDQNLWSQQRYPTSVRYNPNTLEYHC